MDSVQAHLDEPMTPIPLDGDGENSIKDCPQDESDSRGITTSNPKADIGHTPFRGFKNPRQGYRSPPRLYNPAQKMSNPRSFPGAPSSDAGVETPTRAFQLRTASAFPPKSVNRVYPKTPPKSPSSAGSSLLEHTNKPLDFTHTTQTKEGCQKVGTAHVATSMTDKRRGAKDVFWCEEVKKQENAPSDGETTQEGTKHIFRTPPSLPYATLLATTFAPHIGTIVSPNGKEQRPLVSDIPDVEQMHILDDLSAHGTNFIDSNEFWSVSSFHSKTQVIEEKIDILDDTIPSPPLKSYENFNLPVESLLKPMKKSTYHPIEQGDVQKFLADAGWKAESSTQQPVSKGGLWTEKKVPLRPIKLGSSHPVAAATVKPSNTQDDKFLEGVGKSVARIPVRQRRECFSTYIDGYTYTLGENHEAVKDYVKKISTQNTNPPIWHRHRLEQQRAVLITTEVPAKRTKPEAPVVTSTSSRPAPRKVLYLKRGPLTAGLPDLL